MEKKIIKKLSNNAKEIMVIGQSCTDDCKNWVEVSGQTIYYPNMLPCSERVCTGYYYYNSHWTSLF